MKKTALVLMAIAVLFAGGALADTGGATDALGQARFNYGILQTVKDSEVFLFILEELKSGDAEKAAAFLEYQLDEIVVGLSGKLSECNAYQKKQANAALRKIKQYRLKHPRNFEVKSDPPAVSPFLMAENPSVPFEADKILRTIKMD